MKKFILPMGMTFVFIMATVGLFKNIEFLFDALLISAFVGGCLYVLNEEEVK